MCKKLNNSRTHVCRLRAWAGKEEPKKHRGNVYSEDPKVSKIVPVSFIVVGGILFYIQGVYSFYILPFDKLSDRFNINWLFECVSCHLSRARDKYK